MDVNDNLTYLPKDIILDSLLGTPIKTQVPIFGGLDEENIRILNFKLKCVNKTKVGLLFDEDIKNFIGIDFWIEGVEDFFIEELLEERQYKEELTVLKQASTILMGHNDLIDYRKTIKKTIKTKADYQRLL